jgi:undecaprenyl-diphosphatase
MPAAGAGRRMDLSPVAAVVNPGARRADEAAHLPAWVLRRVLGDDDRLESVLRQLVDAGALTIASFGGDGSIGCAAGVAVERRRTLWTPPGGTLNHFARTLGLETVPAAVRALEAGWVARVDIAEANGRAFVNNASLGLYGELVHRREQVQRRLGLGKWPALAVAMAVTLRGATPLALEIDGRPERAYIVFVGNNVYAGLGVGGRDSLQAGVLDLMVLRARGRYPRLAIVAATLLGQLGRSRRLHRRQPRELRIRVDGPTLLAHDGEVEEVEGEIRFRSLPRVLEVVVPPPADGASTA